METRKPTVADTSESSDYQVTVEPGNGKVDFSLESTVIHQFDNRIKKMTLETLKDLGTDNVRTSIIDKGTLDCMIEARIEDVMLRATNQYDNIPWGDAVR